MPFIDQQSVESATAALTNAIPEGNPTWRLTTARHYHPRVRPATWTVWLGRDAPGTGGPAKPRERQPFSCLHPPSSPFLPAIQLTRILQPAAKGGAISPGLAGGSRGAAAPIGLRHF